MLDAQDFPHPLSFKKRKTVEFGENYFKTYAIVLYVMLQRKERDRLP